MTCKNCISFPVCAAKPKRYTGGTIMPYPANMEISCDKCFYRPSCKKRLFTYQIDGDCYFGNYFNLERKKEENENEEKEGS